MIALDTNVLARYLLNDDPAQGQAAVKLLGSGEPLFVPTTVWLELAWVLDGYDCTRAEIARALRYVLGLPGLQTANGVALLRALSAYESGLDFADALHHGLSSRASAMASFDKDFAKAVGRLGIYPPVVRPPQAG